MKHAGRPDAIASHLISGEGGRVLSNDDRSSEHQRYVPPTHVGEKRSLIGMFAFVALLHVLGWGTLIGTWRRSSTPSARPESWESRWAWSRTPSGMRYAFDADHIAAIDNTTRKLMAEQPRPMSVGFWFSSAPTIVFVLVVLIALGVRAMAGQVADEGSLLQRISGVAGVAVSGTFLMVIGILNLVVLIGIIAVFRRMRRGEFDEHALEQHLDSRGFLNRILSGVTKAVRRPRHMYPVGLLFGLGSTPRPRSGCSCWPAARRRSACRGTRS